MDDIRRAKIEVLIPILEAVYTAVDDLASDESGAFNETPANLKETTRGQTSEEAFEALEQASDWIDGAVDLLKNAANIDQPEQPIQSAPVDIMRRV